MNKNFRPGWKALLIAGLLGWAYFPTLCELFRAGCTIRNTRTASWYRSFRLFLLYRNRELAAGELSPGPISVTRRSPLALVFGPSPALLYMLPVDALSLVLCLTGVVMVIGGGPIAALELAEPLYFSSS